MFIAQPMVAEGLRRIHVVDEVMKYFNAECDSIS